MKFLPTLGASRKSADMTHTTGVPRSQMGRPLPPTSRASSNVDSHIKRTYEAVAWVYRCVTAYADGQAQLPIVIRDGQGDSAGDLPAHPFVQLLNFRASDHESSFTFRHRISTQLLLSPRGVFVERLYSRGGDLIGLQLLPPHLTVPIPDEKTFVSAYRVTVGGVRWDIAPELVTWIRAPHPTNPYRSMTPAEAASLAIDTQTLAKMFNHDFLRTGGSPSGIVAIKNGDDGSMLPSDLAELNDRFGGGSRKPNGWVIVDSVDGIDVQEFAGSPNDAKFGDMLSLSKDEIFGVYACPESVVAGNAANRTYANADAEWLIWWEDRIPTHNRIVSNGLDQIDNDPGTFITFDYSGIGVIRRSIEERDARKLDEFRAGAITVDEYRVATGREPFGTHESMTLYQPFTMRPYAVSASAPESTLPVLTEAAPPPVLSVVAGRDRRGTKANRAGADIGTINYDLATKWEQRVTATLVRLFDDQERITLEKLRGPKARKGTRHWTPTPTLTKQIDPKSVYDIANFDTRAEIEASAVFLSLFDDAANATLSALGATNPFDVHNPAVTAAIAARTSRIVGTNQTTRDAIRNALSDGERDGDTIDGLARRVSAVFDDARGYRAEMIARTEVNGSVNAASVAGAKQSGVVESKVWLATLDDRTRPSHADADGQSVGLDEPFDVGGEQLEYPGDENADPAETINCRCTTTYTVTDA